MNSPRRIAVAILLTGAGALVEFLGRVEGALLVGLLAGMLLAPLIPAKAGSCGVRSKPE